MHFFSKEHLAASSGIVGAVGPAALGFALAAQTLRPGSIAVAFFGEGAMNQGMLMESINLAALWNLPVLFVCKDDGWAITTQPGESTKRVWEKGLAGSVFPTLAWMAWMSNKSGRLPGKPSNGRSPEMDQPSCTRTVCISKVISWA